MIALIMFILLFFGKNSAFPPICGSCACGRRGEFSDFFKFDWQSVLELMVALGAMFEDTLFRTILWAEVMLLTFLAATAESPSRSLGSTIKQGRSAVGPGILWLESLHPPRADHHRRRGFSGRDSSALCRRVYIRHAISGLSALQLLPLDRRRWALSEGPVMTHLVSRIL